jgi:hypothetical protein
MGLGETLKRLLRLSAIAITAMAVFAAQAQAATTATLSAQGIAASPSPGCQPKGLWGTALSNAGAVAAGSYRYAVTANGTGAPACPSIGVQVPSDNVVVALQFNPTPGIASASGYTLYRGTTDANLAPITFFASNCNAKCAGLDSGTSIPTGSSPVIAAPSLAPGDHTDTSVAQTIDYGGAPNDNSDDPVTNNPADLTPPALKTDVIHFPGGFLANPQAAAALCAVSAAGPSLLGSLSLHGRNDPNEDTCPPASLVGSVQARVRTPAAAISLVQGDLYQGTRLAGEPGRLLIALRPLCSFHNPILVPNSTNCNALVGSNKELDAAYLTARASIVERSPGVDGIDVALFDISSGADQPLPTSLPVRNSTGTQEGGVTVQVRSLTPTLFGFADQGTAATGDDQPFVTLPTCGVTEFAAEKTTYAASTGTTASFLFTSFPDCPPPPPPPVTPASGSSIIPSNTFTVGKVKKRKLTVTVASAGRVDVRQAGSSGSGASASARKRLLKPSSATGGPGRVIVKLRLTAAAGKALRLKHKLTVKAKVTFTPTGGTAASKTALLTLKG